MPRLNRRQILLAAAPLALTMSGYTATRGSAAPAPGRFGEPQPFDFGVLQQTAGNLAAKPYVVPKSPAADLIATIDFDVAQKIKFRPDRELFAAGPGPFPVRLFHVDKFNPLPVQINILAGGTARRVIYSPQDFEYGAPGLAEKLPKDLGFSGFRVMDGPQAITDWLAFQGASYFRSSGQENQYGGSARGIAVNTVASSKEEFPRFVEFWLAEPQAGRSSITIYALLDGPSLTGAYQFDAAKESGAVMQVRAKLFPRTDIAQLGIAPLTSMYWYGENERHNASDWRPEIHDSDGLALWTGKGERIWRPLIDPPSVLTNSFLDENPKAFGLMQRDRDFADYQDDGAFYNRRPSMWVEPQGDWGAGRGAAGRNSDAGRDPRQYRRLLDAPSERSKPATNSICRTNSIGGTTSRIRRPTSAASPPHGSGRVASPVSPNPKTRTAGSSWSISSAGRCRRWRRVST